MDNKVSFRPLKKGIRELFLSPEMENAIQELVDKKAKKACRSFARRHKSRRNRDGTPPYVGYVTRGKKTMLGRVVARGLDGVRDQNQYHTLDKLNH